MQKTTTSSDVEKTFKRFERAFQHAADSGATALMNQLIADLYEKLAVVTDKSSVEVQLHRLFSGRSYAATARDQLSVIQLLGARLASLPTDTADWCCPKADVPGYREFQSIFNCFHRSAPKIAHYLLERMPDSDFTSTFIGYCSAQYLSQRVLAAALEPKTIELLVERILRHVSALSSLGRMELQSSISAFANKAVDMRSIRLLETLEQSTLHADFHKWLSQDEALIRAATVGNVAIFNWLTRKSELVTPQTLRKTFWVACQNGNTELVSWFLKSDESGALLTPINAKAVSRALGNGFKLLADQVLMRASSLLPTPLSAGFYRNLCRDAIPTAAANGNLEVLQTLVKICKYHVESAQVSAAVKYSAANGHLEILKWLHQNFQEQIDLTVTDHYAVRYAAQKAQLEIVKYILEQMYTSTQLRDFKSIFKALTVNRAYKPAIEAYFAELLFGVDLMPAGGIKNRRRLYRQMLRAATGMPTADVLWQLKEANINPDEWQAYCKDQLVQKACETGVSLTKDDFAKVLQTPRKTTKRF